MAVAAAKVGVVTNSRTSEPKTTILRALTALALCAALIAFVMTLSTAFGWLARPELGPHSALEAVGAFAFVFGLWALNVAVFLAVFAGIPWAILHFIGYRSWWIAPVAGFFVAFAVAYFVTVQNSQSYPKLHSSTWIDGRATIVDGRLTAYGHSLHGPAAAARNGALFGLVGAAIGFILWRIAYRRYSPPESSVQ